MMSGIEILASLFYLEETVNHDSLFFGVGLYDKLEIIFDIKSGLVSGLIYSYD